MKRRTRVLVGLGLLVAIGVCSAWCWLQTPAGSQWHMRYTNERRARYLRGLAPADLRRVTLVCVFGDPDDPEPYELILTPEKDREAVAQIVSALRDIEPFGDFFQAVPTEWLILTPVHGRNIVVSPCYLWGKPDADGKYTLLEGFRSSRLIPVLQEITRTYKHRVKRMTPQTE